MHQHRQKQQEHHKDAHVILCLIIFSDYIKQYSATIIAHIKRIIELFKIQNIMPNTLGTIWEITYGCDERYICATALYLISMFS